MASGLAPPYPSSGSPIEMRLVVWFEHGTAWRARVSGPGLEDREFASPFELARFVAWPVARAPSTGGGRGLR